MTIVELRDRLTAIIEDNKSHRWDERNDSEVIISNKISKRVTEYSSVKYASGAWLGLHKGTGLDSNEQYNGIEHYFEIILDEPIARYGGRK